MPFIASLLLGVALQVGSTLLGQAFAPKPKAVVNLPGMRGQYSTGGTVPMTIILGTKGVAGQLEYSNAWGNSGETPHAFNVDVISFSDYRTTAVTAQWTDSTKVTLPGTGALARGKAIEEPAKFDGYSWYIHHLGDQSVADAYLLDKFGVDSQRPWLSDMVGEGISYAVQTARINEKLWNDFPRYVFEVQGAPVFDPRLSTAAGGSGSQVWGTFSTYAFSDNAAVIALNILLGIRDPDGNFIWGGRATLAQFDYANLAAAMDRCDDLIDKKGGGTEKRYRVGLEVSINERPADVLRDIQVASNLRITYTRGKYWFLVDVPSTSDGSFADGDLLIKEPIEFSWFPNLDDAPNGIAATFFAPGKAWEERPTKPYYRSDLEAEDHGQINREKLALRCVFSGSQAQRLIKAIIEEGRRFKGHVVCLPDTYRNYRPLQCLAWTSDEFQYSSKLFLIISRTEDEFGNIWFALQEIDPADFDWDAETDETELTFASTEESPVPSQAVAGWAVEPWDDGGRRPGVHMEWTGALDDIRVTRVQFRHDGDTLPLLDREYPYETGEATQDIYISGDPLLRNIAYNVRVRFIPFDGSGRETEWSDWLTVTTPDVGLGPDDFGDTLTAMNDFFGLSIRDINEEMMLATSGVADQDLANYSDKQFVLNQMRVSVANATTTITAGYTEAILLLADDIEGAYADYVSAIDTLYGDVSTGVLFRMTSYAGPGGGWSRVGFETRASMGDVWATASIYLEAKTDGSSRAVIKASETYFLDDANNIVAAFAAGGASFNNAYIVNLTAANITTDSLTLNRLTIAGRGATSEDITFEHNASAIGTSAADRVAWSSGTVGYVDATGTATSAAISAGSTSTWAPGTTMYIYWPEGATSFSVTTTRATAVADGNVMVATYKGGKKLNVKLGTKIILDGDDLKTLSVLTSAVANNNITVVGADVAAAAVNITNTSPSIPSAWVDIATFSLTVVSTGTVVLIGSTTPYSRSLAAGSDGGVEVAIYRDSTQLVKREVAYDVGEWEREAVTLMWEDSPGAGTFTYALRARVVLNLVGGTGTGNNATARTGSGLVAIHRKK